MGKVAFIFPGQASQYSGMGKELAEKYSAARAIFDEADKALGFSISKVSKFGERQISSLMTNEGIVRNEKKIRSTIYNAQQAALIEKEFDSFNEYFKSFGKNYDKLMDDAGTILGPPLLLLLVGGLLYWAIKGFRGAAG